jgi:ABC-type nitrate/sulfonate/bicarbonate transport system ATPase subunit
VVKQYFTYDERLGINLPSLQIDWEDYPFMEQQKILTHWETIRGNIPDRIQYLEKNINSKQEQLNNEDNFLKSCQLNSDIASLASIINDLWIWFRSNQTVTESKMHS